VKWNSLAMPKYLGGWGLKNIFLFSKALTTNSYWRLISTNSLLTQVVIHKYINLTFVKEWIRNPLKKNSTCSIIWKSIISSFEVVVEGLAWHIGKGNLVHIGSDPCPGTGVGHILPTNLFLSLHAQGIFFLNHISDPAQTTI